MPVIRYNAITSLVGLIMRYGFWIVFLWASTSLGSTHQPFADLLTAINHAKQSIDIHMYSWSGLQRSTPSGPVEQSLLQAKQRGVDIQIIFNHTPPAKLSRTQRKRQDIEMRWCRRYHLSCTWSSDAFCHSHAKTILIDHQLAVIMTGNLPWRNQRSTVNQLILSHNPRVIRYMDALFKTDLHNAHHQHKATPSPIPPQLVVSPVNSEDQITQLMASAKRSLAIEQPFLDNHHRIPAPILDALESALKRQVNIKLLTSLTRGNTLNPALSALAHRYSKLRIHVVNRPFIHSKSMLVDKQRLLIGSINWSWSSLHCNREIALITKNQRAMRLWRQTFNQLWRGESAEKLVSP